VAVLAGGALAFFASAFVVAYRLSHRSGPPGTEPVPSELVGVVVPMRIRSTDGLSLGAWYASGSEGGVSIVLAHGNGGSRTQLADEILDFHEAGDSCLAITMRAHGDSDGDMNDIGFHASRDVVAAVDRMRALRPRAPIVVYGESMGAAAALFAARTLRNHVAGYVLVAPYADLDTAVHRRVVRYLPAALAWLAHRGLRAVSPFVFPDLARIRPVDAARQIPASTPVLILVGTDDDRAPRSDADAIRSRVHQGCVVPFPGLTHESFHRGDPRRWRETVLPFVARSGTPSSAIGACARIAPDFHER